MTTRMPVETDPSAINSQSATATATATTNSHNSHNTDSRFSCNICLDPVLEPVVTQCGHLYCWPCLYRWLKPGIAPQEAFWTSLPQQQVDQSRRCCPVCKAPCTVPTLVPIFVRNELEPVHSTPPHVNNDDNHNHTDNHNDNTTALPEEHPEDGVEGLDHDWEDSLVQHANEEEEPSQLPPEERSSHQQELPLPSIVESPDRQSLPPPQQPQEGLRQRLRFRSNDSEIPNYDDDENHDDRVPSRPSPTRAPFHHAPHHNHTPNNNIMVGRPTTYRTPLSPMPQNNRASLSHGLLLLFHQALQGTNDSANNNQSSNENDHVPSFHQYRQGGSDEQENAHNHAPQPLRPADETTEFLSRLLLMLGSFVILCLLIF